MRTHRIARASVVMALSLLLAGCKNRQPALTDHPRNFPGVAMHDETFFSAALHRAMPYRVYLPLTAGTELPTVYLLHGCGSGYRDWSNYSDVGAYATRGVLFVMAEGACSYYMNAALKPEDKYEDYLIQDLITDVESHFPAERKREGRAIVGVSMGGFAAIKLALSRPDLFSFAGAISPAVDVPGRRFTWMRWSQSVRFRTIFGPTGSDMRAKNDPFELYKTADPDKTPFLYITAGEDEPLLAPIRRFTVLLKERGYGYEFDTKPGGHDWGEWDQQVPGCLDSLLEHLKRRDG